jgi:hypothetical protein
MPQNRFIVIKEEDADKYLPNHDQIDLGHILRQIRNGREKDGKTNNNFYAVINTDEPYFEEIKNIMKKNGHWEE